MRTQIPGSKCSVHGASKLLAIVVVTVFSVPGSLLAQPETCVLGSEPPAFAPAPGDDALHPLPHARESGHSGLHGQGLYGVDRLYLSHLPVFMGAPRSHPHNFQVILEVELDDATAKARYKESRAQNPTTLYTVTPPHFDQTALVTGYPGRGPLNRLPGSLIFRGHFEQGGVPIVQGVAFDVRRVVYFREFYLGGLKLDRQHYLVFGGEDDLVAVHLLSAPPDFDQILRLELTLPNIPEALISRVREALAEGLYLHLPERPNRVETRLREGGELTCDLNLDGELSPRAVKLELREERYCEAGEFSQLVIEEFNRPESCAG